MAAGWSSLKWKLGNNTDKQNKTYFVLSIPSFLTGFYDAMLQKLLFIVMLPVLPFTVI
jgi:hypothetical protein